MNKTIKISACVLSAAAILFSIGGTILRTWLLLNAYRAEDGFYTDSALHALLRYPLIALAAIAFVWAHIYIKEGNRQISLPDGKILNVVSMIVGCVLGGFFLYTFAKIVLPIPETPDIFQLIMCVFAVAAMLYYFTCGKNSDFRALLCLCSALVLLVMIFGLYFDESVSYINSSVVLCFAASIFTMLATTAESNFLLGRSAYRRYLSYAPTAVALCFTLSIPDLLLFFADRVVALTDIYYDILLLVFGVYHLVRLVLITMQTVKEEA